MKTPEGIVLVDASFQDVVALLKSEALSVVDQAIAAALQMPIRYDFDSACVGYAQGDISVSGMTPHQIEEYLKTNSDAIIDFGTRFMHDIEATSEEQEYPEGESQDSIETVEVLGYANGFGITLAIYHNFVARRSGAELDAYLKNRQIPKRARFAKAIYRIFDGTAKPTN